MAARNPIAWCSACNYSPPNMRQNNDVRSYVSMHIKWRYVIGVGMVGRCPELDQPAHIEPER